MTKQEEISDIMDGVAIGEIKPVAALRMLSDLGVVIKDKDRALPAGTMTLIGGDNNALKVIAYLRKAGYIAVLPLVE